MSQLFLVVALAESGHACLSPLCGCEMSPSFHLDTGLLSSSCGAPLDPSERSSISAARKVPGVYVIEDSLFLRQGGCGHTGMGPVCRPKRHRCSILISKLLLELKIVVSCVIRSCRYHTMKIEVGCACLDMIQCIWRI